MTKKYKWYDNLQYAVMLLLAAVIPFGWRYGLWVALLLAVVSLVKLGAECGKRAAVSGRLSFHRFPLVALGPVVYWLMLAVSMLWTTDLAAGWTVLRLKAVMLIFPLCFLLTDTSYLSHRHLRGIAYALLLATCVAFLYFIVRAGIDMAHGGDFKAFNNAFHERLKGTGGVYHHAYIALYALMALIFVYHELSTRWKELRGWHRVLLFVAALLLFCYIIVVNSRAGILATVLVFVGCMLHQMFHYRRWWQTAAVALLLAAGGIGVVQMVPGRQNRIISTVQEIQKKGDEGDARILVNQASWHAWQRSPWVGYGVGDYLLNFADQCRYDNTASGYSHLNAHNQYMESLLAAGIPGLLALLFFLLAPLCGIRRSRHGFPLLMATVVVLFNLLFESMFERQMGLLFIGYLYAYMVLILSAEKNNFGQVEKS